MTEQERRHKLAAIAGFRTSAELFAYWNTLWEFRTPFDGEWQALAAAAKRLGVTLPNRGART